MVLVLTVVEQNRFVQETIGTLTSRGTQSYVDKVLLFKVLAIAVDKSIPNNKYQFSQMDERLLKNPEVLDSCLQDLLAFLSEYVIEEEETVTYTTTELAEIFDVSVQTIHNWIEAGRFVGIEKGKRNKHIEIAGNTAWKARNGKMHLVSDFVKEWEEEKARVRGASVTSDNEYDFLVNRVVKFEEQYGGEWGSTLGKKDIKEMTAQEESDASMWRYFLERLKTCRRN
ncbi:hypothetical protein CN495_08155 [Bacillus thuringiensis]|uniref:Helix-turn-helix domain-containing protein n=1 Tax=Bacillus thuringiensis TaxID=1428 RepID=A0ABD6S8A0_BACTU|nr:hypothetical protein CN495_08155 [Bacillus thuringiensis]